MLITSSSSSRTKLTSAINAILPLPVQILNWTNRWIQKVNVFYLGSSEYNISTYITVILLNSDTVYIDSVQHTLILNCLH